MAQQFTLSSRTTRHIFNDSVNELGPNRGARIMKRGMFCCLALLAALPAQAADDTQARLGNFAKQFGLQWAGTSDGCSDDFIVAGRMNGALGIFLEVTVNPKTAQANGSAVFGGLGPRCGSIVIPKEHLLLDWPSDLPSGEYVVAAKREKDGVLRVVGVLDNTSIKDSRDEGPREEILKWFHDQATSAPNSPAKKNK
jgi:hypothetical protein